MLYIPPQPEQLAAWLGRLVQIPSVTPAQAGPRAGVPGEARLAEAVAGWFRDFGGEVFIDEALPGRANVYGVWRGRTQRWAGLDVHLDTVGVEQMLGDPFSGVLRDGRVYGRGAVDTKASLAVALALLEAMHRQGVAPEANLLIAATVDEEEQAFGASTFAAWLRRRALMFDELMVAEPTRCCPVYGHTGVVRLTFAIAGQAAHSSQPQLGNNAIAAAAPLLLALDAEHQRLQAQPATALGAPTLTVTLINGGRGLNIVPDACQVSIDRRVVADESPNEIISELYDLAQRACPLPLTMQTHLALDAFYQDPAAAWVQALAAWTEQPPIIAPYGTNAYAYADVARACVVLGPGAIDQAHGVEEWVDLTELVTLAAIYTRWWGSTTDS